MSKKGEALRYYIGVGYYVLGMVDANNRPMMYQREKMEISREEFAKVKKQIQECRERIVYHPMDCICVGQPVVLHHHQPLSLITCWYEGKLKHIIVPDDAGRIVSGRTN